MEVSLYQQSLLLMLPCSKQKICSIESQHTVSNLSCCQWDCSMLIFPIEQGKHEIHTTLDLLQVSRTWNGREKNCAFAEKSQNFDLLLRSQEISTKQFMVSYWLTVDFEHEHRHSPPHLPQYQLCFDQDISAQTCSSRLHCLMYLWNRQNSRPHGQEVIYRSVFSDRWRVLQKFCLGL